jgi:hypothetical protein
MATLYSPINDSFETVLTDLVSSIVEDWDLKTCVEFCNENLVQNWKGFSLEELAEQYELHYNSSIVCEVIDWKAHLKTGEPDWQQFSRAEYHPVKITGVSGGTEIIRVLEDNEEPDFYSVYLVDHVGMSQCILDLANEDEAKVLTESINTHYLEQGSNDSE